MINCPKCGADNLIGAIFCRTCGEKLNIEDLSPEVFDAPPEPLAAKIGRIGGRVVLFLLIVGIVGVLVGLFWPAKVTYKGSLDQNAGAKAGRKYQAVQTPSPNLPPEVPFSSDEATSIANQELGLPRTQAGSRKPMLLSIEFLGNGNCKFILKSLLFSQVPMFVTVIATPEVSSPGSVSFQVRKVQVGALPLPGGLRKLGLDQFRALDATTTFSAAQQSVKGVTIGADSCKIAVRR
jgi:hypothetical protein